MSFVERAPAETLAEHLLRNAEALALSLAQVQRLRQAFQLLRGTRRQQADGGRIAVEVRCEVDGAIIAAVAAARARGERVQRFNDAGAYRIKGSDGIASLTEAGALTPAEIQAATAYRQCFEGSTSSLGSSLRNAGGTGGGSLTAVARLHQTYLKLRLDKIDQAIGHMSRDRRELAVLRAVAGRGETLRSLGAGGDTKKANLRALKRALARVPVILACRARPCACVHGRACESGPRSA